MPTRDELLTILINMRNRFIEEIDKLDQNVGHLNATISLLEKEMKEMRVVDTIPSPPPDFPVTKLRNMTQQQAVLAIAQHNGGIVRAQDAKRLMIRAGVMRDTKNSTNITHNVILRSGQFERIAPGEYRLKMDVSTKDTGLFNAPVQ